MTLLSLKYNYLHINWLSLMNTILSAVKKYISTGSFILILLLIYIFSDSNEYAKSIIDYALPVNGKLLAFFTILGLVFIYEVYLRHKSICDNSHNKIIECLGDITTKIEETSLISDVNSAFNSFKLSGKEFVTGSIYQKEIYSLEDNRKRLKVNSYTEAKMKFLISKIKQD